MQGEALAPAAGTVLNALATGVGSAFAIDEYTRASVRLKPGAGPPIVEGTIAEDPDGDTTLIETCVERTVERVDADIASATVQTESEVPMAAGLKSSSAAANATVLATLDALDAVDDLDREAAARVGVDAAREAGVTVTGAYDDASASMLGGVTVTNNEADAVLAREAVDWSVLVWAPDETAYSADADVGRCEQVAAVARTVESLAIDGEYREAMTVNGLAFCAALEFDPEPIVEALGHVDGATLSGTGPSFVAVGPEDALERVREDWNARPGTTLLTETQREGAYTV